MMPYAQSPRLDCEPNGRAAISLGIGRKRARGGHYSDIHEGIMTQRDPGSISSARIGIAACRGDDFPVKGERPRQAPNSHGPATIDFDWC
jgi:hypothetical protein